MIDKPSKSLTPRQRRKLTSIAIGSAIVGTAGIWWLGQQQPGSKYVGGDPIVALSQLKSPERDRQLGAIADGKQGSINTYRARYVLAADAIAGYQPEVALQRLAKLEQDYPLMAPYILWKRAQAYQQLNYRSQLNETLQRLVNEYPQSPVVVEALYLLGQKESKYWQQAIDKFPSYPRTLQIITEQLSQTPNRIELLVLLLKYLDDNSNRRLKVADRLVMEYTTELKPEDWDLVGNVYWQNQVYKKVANPLTKGSATPQNAYRIARSHYLSDRKEQAPHSEEAAKSTLDLVNLTPTAEALAHLDRTIGKSSGVESAIAMAKKAKILAENQNLAGSQAVATEMMAKYPHTEAVAQYRWDSAWEIALAGNFDRAWAMAKQIVTDTPQSQHSARASFWIGKWAQKLNKPEEARRAFEYTIENYPRSYYSWRSAHYLGWGTGDFDSTIQFQPQIDRQTTPPTLPIGSPTLKELTILGQHQEAWDLWQTELPDRDRPKLVDLLAEGFLYQNLGRQINTIASLNKIEADTNTPEAANRSTIMMRSDYWQALYPLLYIDNIQSVGKNLKINPLLIISVIRQESKFSPTIESPAKAKGLMQLIPDTAKFSAHKLKVKEFDLAKPADNIKLGSWYLKFTHDRYKNNTMLAIAGYNAGPGNVEKWLKEFGGEDLDLFVERIPFPETQNYVTTVLANYWNYLILYNPQVRMKMAPFLR
jgi:soluble lytic murein transglycosylase